MGVKAVLFDMGGTLFIDVNAWQIILDNILRVLRDYGYSVDRASLDSALRDWTSEVELTEMDRVEYSNVLRVTCALKKLNLPLNPRLVWSIFKAYNSGVVGGHVLDGDALDVLDRLKSEGYILGVISNASSYETTYELILRYGLDKYFDLVISSQAVVWKKPTREIFHLACRLLNVKPSETVYVGDDPKNDIEGAKMAGLKAVQKVVEGRVVSNLADAVIYRLSELPRVIDKLKQ